MAVKLKTLFFCKNCGHESAKWLGKCPSCEEWNTFSEEIVAKSSNGQESPKGISSINGPMLLSDIEQIKETRIPVPDTELNRLLGGGLVPSSLILFGGEPGIGKSTLLLQIALSFQDLKVLYISGEESEKQIKMRADRIGVKSDSCFILTETNTQNILQAFEKLKPDLVIIDSIQTLHSNSIEASPGSISQIKTTASEMLQVAKTTGVPIFLIGHITKDGGLAGPKVLEHMVDAVLLFEGERNHMYRILRTTKNRFGSTQELGIYEMKNSGLMAVEDPSQILLNQRDEATSGIAIAAAVEGMRPILVEVQALVSSAVYGMPQRSSTGFNSQRLNMLLAVLEKRCGFKLGAKDVFLNLTGGVRIDDPSLDLAVAMSVMSSFIDQPLPDKCCFAAEIGLSGELRPSPKIDLRISEAQKLGFDKIIISEYNKGLSQKNYTIELFKTSKIQEVFRKFLS